MSYVGTFTHQLDARNRVTVPSCWRVAGDDSNYYLAWPHPERCIAVFPPEMQAELLAKARAIRQGDLRGQALLRELFGKGFKFGCDKQGRIVLPEALISHAGIAKEAVLVGLGRNFQIWSPARFQPVDADFNVLEAMENLGI
jgi:MraZ protein